MSRKIGIGLIGCGVVGTGVLRLLDDHGQTIEERLGAPIEVVGIVARNLERQRDPIVPADKLQPDWRALVAHPEVDIVVELIGGIEPAGEIVRAAIEQGKHVVTANKALLAEAGDELLQLAEERKVDLYYEAAVAGGIPIIRVLREAMASDRVVALRGIVNGTSNYILSRMRDEGVDYAVALKGAQEAGYAEADPSLDVGGGDACHKLSILATLAFGAKVHPHHVYTEGIERVAAIDMKFAERFGYVIKPLAIARAVDGNELDLRVHPALLPKGSLLATISGALNAVDVEGAMLGPSMFSGMGAGALPTAMSVVSDIVDVGRNLLVGAHGRVPSRALRRALLPVRVRDVGEHRGRYYLRFGVVDRPGVLAAIAGVLGQHQVSIEQMVQEGVEDSNKPVSIVIFTHECREANVQAALKEIDALEPIIAGSLLLRLESA